MAGPDLKDPTLTFAQLRDHGLLITCMACLYHGRVDLEPLAARHPNKPWRSVFQRLVCTKCGARAGYPHLVVKSEGENWSISVRAVTPGLPRERPWKPER
jgi:hypothetical protein